MKRKDYLKKGVCFSLAAAMLLTGCTKGSTPASNDTGDVQKDIEISDAKSNTNLTNVSDNDQALFASLRDKYGAATVDYADDIIRVDRNESITFNLDFNPADKGIDSFKDYFTVYQDADMQYALENNIDYDYATNTITIDPPTLGIAEPTQASGSDVTLDGLSGSYLYNDDTKDNWGNLPELYLVQKIDTKTGEELETPIIHVIKTNTELVGAPVVQYTCDENGVATMEWTPVDGATEYIVFKITKDENYGNYTDGTGFNNYSYAIARTKDTSWKPDAYVSEGTGNTLLMNQTFCNFSLSEDDKESEFVTSNGDASGDELINEESGEKFSDIYVDYVGVIAVDANGSSAVSNMCSLKTYSQLLPYEWAWNRNNQENESNFRTEVSLLPAEMNVTMCDGTTAKRVMDYDIKSYKQESDDTIEINGRAEGTLLDQTFLVRVEDPSTLDQDLADLKERQDNLKSKGGMVENGLTITEDITQTTPEDAPQVEEPEETTPEEATTSDDATVEELETPQPDEETTDGDAEVPLNTDISVTANSALSEYIAIQMLNSKEVIDLNLFTESRNTDEVIDAYMEAKYQNPLVMGIYGAAYDENNRLLYVQYDDTVEDTEQKREVTLQKANEIVSQIITEDMSDLDKEIAINQYLCDNGVYDDAALENAEKYNFQSVDKEFIDSFTPYGILVNGVGVCASYASSFKLLADQAGLQSIVVTGTLNGNLSHAWNRVNIDGQWLSVDATNNDGDEIQNALLNISDDCAEGVLVSDDRFVLDDKVSSYVGDTDDKEYYHLQDKYFDKDQIVDKLADGLSASDDVVLRTDYNINDDEFQEAVQKVADAVGGKVSGYYWLGVIHLQHIEK